jgi:hypothetical protein
MEEINQFIKNEFRVLRITFLDVVYIVDKPLGQTIKSNLDELVNGITDAIFDPTLKLAMESVYEKHIGLKILDSKNKLFGSLYNFKGVTSPVSPPLEP